MNEILTLEELKSSITKESKKEKLERARKEYLNEVNNAIVNSYSIGMVYASVDVKEELYDTYKLANELNEKGYETEILLGTEPFTGSKTPFRLIIRW